ncbi:MAG: hypothetical protein ACM3Q1_01230 [Bacteroidales bacterium]
MKRAALIIILLALLSHRADAHQDRVLHLTSNGAIIELPPEYQPATLVLDFGRAIKLRLGNKETILPRCLVRLPTTQELKDVQITGSWYHDENIIPYYIEATFFDPGHSQNTWARSGYSYLFNLHTSRLIEAKRIEAGEGGNNILHKQIDVHSKCTREEIEDAFGAH